ncbi:MAG: hypothetical protein DWI03_00290 [Planctomycetota bacterium]|nr:MAG: hypothetical protein DWI03_00290 [Planctomycetota bacterium]
MVCVVTCGAVRADDDRVVEEAGAGPAAAQEPHFIELGANFDANLFEQSGNGWVLRGGGVRLGRNGVVLPNGAGGVQSSESSALRQARALGEKRLARLDEACRLSETQRQALHLAIESDIRRFVDDVDAVRSRYDGLRINMNDQAGQKQWHQFQQDVQRCRNQLRGLFDEQSLFGRVLAGTLDEQQLAGVVKESRARRSFRWRAMVAATLVKMDDALGLSQRQHESIERTLLAREPALRTDDPAAERDDAHLQMNLVYMVLSEADAGPIKTELSERQWRTLALFMNQGKAMRSWIEQQGVLESRRP